jgi:hypothetical protein
MPEKHYYHADGGLFIVTVFGVSGVIALLAITMVLFEPLKPICMLLMIIAAAALVYEDYLWKKEDKEIEDITAASKKVKTITIEDVKSVDDHAIGVLDSDHTFYVVIDYESKMYMEKGKTLTVEIDKPARSDNFRIIRVIS